MRRKKMEQGFRGLTPSRIPIASGLISKLAGRIGITVKEELARF